MPSREEIRSSLDAQRQLLLKGVANLDSAVVEQPCTENQTPGGEPWTTKDHLAHLAEIERSFVGVVNATLAGEPKPLFFEGSNRNEIMANLHKSNEANVEQHRSRTIDEVLADMEGVRAGTLALLDGLTDEQLGTPIPESPFGDGSIGALLAAAGYHDQMHWKWVEDGLASAS